MITKTNFLNKFKGVTLTCPECKRDVEDDFEKLNIRDKGKCLKCRKDLVYIPVTNSYYKIRTKDTPRGNKGSIISKLKESV